MLLQLLVHKQGLTLGIDFECWYSTKDLPEVESQVALCGKVLSCRMECGLNEMVKDIFKLLYLLCCILQRTFNKAIGQSFCLLFKLLEF